MARGKTTELAGLKEVRQMRLTPGCGSMFQNVELNRHKILTISIQNFI